MVIPSIHAFSVCETTELQYFVGREWQVREGLEPSKLNVINQALISVENILPPCTTSH